MDSSDSKQSQASTGAVTRGRLTFQYTALEMIRQYKMSQERKSTGQEIKDESVQKNSQIEDMTSEYEHIEPDDPTEESLKIMDDPWENLPKRKITQTYINQQSLIYSKMCEDLQKLIENSKSNAQNSSGAANMNDGAGENTQEEIPHPPNKKIKGMDSEAKQIAEGSTENDNTPGRYRVTHSEEWWNDFRRIEARRIEAVIRYCREAVVSHTALWNFKNELLKVLVGGTGVIVKSLILSQSTDIQILTAVAEMLFKLLLDHIAWVYEGNSGLVTLLTPRLPSIIKELASFVIEARDSGEAFIYKIYTRQASSLVYDLATARWFEDGVVAFMDDISSGIQILAIEQVNYLTLKDC